MGDGWRIRVPYSGVLSLSFWERQAGSWVLITCSNTPTLLGFWFLLNMPDHQREKKLQVKVD